MNRTTPRQPWSLKTFASQVKYENRNNLLHKLVLDNCLESPTHSETSVLTTLKAFCPASANAKNRHGFSALHLAVIKRNAFMVEALLSCFPALDADAKCQNVRGGTALHLLASSSVCVSPEDRYNQDYRPMHRPNLREDRVKIGKLLLSRGASTASTDNSNRTPFERGLESQSVDCLKLFIKRGGMQTQDSCRGGMLLQAVNAGCLERLSGLVSRGFPLDRRDICGFTALHVAVLLSHVHLVEYLVSEGANVNARADCGSTPLHMLMENHGRHFRCPELRRIAEILVDNGARMNFRDEYGQTPLALAARENLPDHIELFLENGAKLVDRDDRGRTPLHAAVLENGQDAVKVLVDSGAGLDVRDLVGRTPLHYAARGRLTDMLLYLVDRNADVNSTDNRGKTPLHDAVDGGCLATVEALVAHGAVHAKSRDGLTPLEMAKQKKQTEIAEFLSIRFAEKKSGKDRLEDEGPPAKRARIWDLGFLSLDEE